MTTRGRTRTGLRRGGGRTVARKILRDRVQPIPSLVEVDPAGQDPVSVGSEEGLASLASLSDLPLDNRTVTAFVQSFTNSTIQVQGLQ